MIVLYVIEESKTKSFDMIRSGCRPRGEFHLSVRDHLPVGSARAAALAGLLTSRVHSSREGSARAAALAGVFIRCEYGRVRFEAALLPQLLDRLDTVLAPLHIYGNLPRT